MSARGVLYLGYIAASLSLLKPNVRVHVIMGEGQVVTDLLRDIRSRCTAEFVRSASRRRSASPLSVNVSYAAKDGALQAVDVLPASLGAASPYL